LTELLKRDDNIVIVLTLSEWLQEMRQYEESRAVIEEALTRFDENSYSSPEKAEEILTRLIMFYAEASEAVRDYSRAIAKLEMGLSKV
jgi:hypothetical protein